MTLKKRQSTFHRSTRQTKSYKLTDKTENKEEANKNDEQTRTWEAGEGGGGLNFMRDKRTIPQKWDVR